VDVSRQQGQSVSGPLLDALMRADASTLPAWVGLDLGAQGYAVARVNTVLPRTDPDAAAATQERSQIAQWLSGAESQAYYEVLKERFKVQIKIPRPQVGAEVAPNDQ